MRHTRTPEGLDEETSARLRALPATEIAALVRSGEVDPARLVRTCLTEIGAEQNSTIVFPLPLELMRVVKMASEAKS